MIPMLRVANNSFYILSTQQNLFFSFFVELKVKNKDRYLTNLPQFCVDQRREVPWHEAVDLLADMHRDETVRWMHGLCGRVNEVADAMVRARCVICLNTTAPHSCDESTCKKEMTLPCRWACTPFFRATFPEFPSSSEPQNLLAEHLSH
jgi:hypothetical protein